MASIVYSGYAKAVSEIVSVTPANVEVGDVFTILLGVKSVSFTATATTVANVIAGLLTAIEAADYPEFDEITWSNATTYLKGIGPDDGRPFSDGMTCSATNGGAANTQTLTKAVLTAGTGPEDWENVQNWVGGVLPVAGETAIIGLYPYAPKYNLPSGGNVPDMELVRSQYQGLFVGLPMENPEGYREYLNPRYQGSYDAIDIGTGDGPFVPGGNFVITPALTSVIRIHSTERRNSDGTAPVNFNGSVGVDQCTIPICNGAVDFGNPKLDVTGTYEGFGCASIVVGQGGDVHFFKNTSALTKTVHNGGTLIDESNGSTTFNANSGSSTIIAGNSGNITTLNIQSDAFVDFRRPCTVTTTHNAGRMILTNDPRTGKTFTNLDLYAGAEFDDGLKVGTYTNGIDCNRCTPGKNVLVNVGENVRLTIGTPS